MNMRTITRWAAVVVLGLSGCGEGSTDNQSNLAEVTSAVSISGTYWKSGTENPATASCTGGDVMIGTAFDGNLPLVKCATMSGTVMDTTTSYNGTDTILTVNPACANPTTPHDATVGFSENGDTGATSITCQTDHTHSWAGTYVDGSGYTTWGQEWFMWNGDWVFGHICGKSGYVVRAYNIDNDLFVCGT
jgi:hypothetical protein